MTDVLVTVFFTPPTMTDTFVIDFLAPPTMTVPSNSAAGGGSSGTVRGNVATVAAQDPPVVLPDIDLVPTAYDWSESLQSTTTRSPDPDVVEAVTTAEVVPDGVNVCPLLCAIALIVRHDSSATAPMVVAVTDVPDPFTPECVDADGIELSVWASCGVSMPVMTAAAAARLFDDDANVTVQVVPLEMADVTGR